MGGAWCKSRKARNYRETTAQSLIESVAQMERLAKELQSTITRAEESDPTHAPSYASIKELKARLELTKKTIPKLKDRIILLQSSPDYVSIMTKGLNAAEKVANTAENDTDNLAELRDTFQTLADREQLMENNDDDVLQHRTPAKDPLSVATEGTSLLDDAPSVPVSHAPAVAPSRSFAASFNLV